MEVALAIDHSKKRETFQYNRGILQDIAAKFNAGLTMTEIGNEYGITRSAIAGRIKYMRTHPEWGIEVTTPKPRGRPSKPAPENDESNVVKFNQNSLSLAKRIEAKKRPRTRLRLVVDDCEVKPEELKTYHCQFPIGEPHSPDFRFCGKSQYGGKPYCKHHTEICFVPPKPRLKPTPYRR